MKPAGRITGIVVFLVFLIGIVTARAGDNRSAETPVDTTAETEIRTTAKYIDPDLENILAVKDIERYEFLSRLTPEEQHELARMIKKRVDDEAGVVASLMAVVSSFVPAFMAAPFADKLEPATVARISDKISTSKATAIARRLDPVFLAEVAVYQDPKKVTAVVEGLPEPLLVDITRILIWNKEYRVVANFSDDMTAEKLRNVTNKIDDPASLLRIVRYMQNKDKVVETAAMLADDYLLDFMGLISSSEDYEMAAAIGLTMDLDRQAYILNRLEPQQAARLTAHYPAENIVLLMEKTDDQRLEDVASRLSSETLGLIAEAITPQALNRFLKVITREQMLTVLPHINLMRLEAAWPELTPEARTTLRDISREYPLLAEAIAFIEENRKKVSGQ